MSDPASVAGAATLKYALQNSSAFKALIEKARNYFKLRGKLTVIISGDGGVGKSTLGAFLSMDEVGRVDFTSKEYYSNAAPEMVSLKRGYFADVYVLPGQSTRRHLWKESLQLFSQGKVNGIVNVVSWGYPATTLSLEDMDDLENKDFASYRSGALHEEINALHEIKGGIKLANKRIWMITLINKEDLWYKSGKEVLQYYENGEYGKIIKDLIHGERGLGPDKFIHEYAIASFVPCNLKDSKGHILAPCQEGYDTNRGRGSVLKFTKLFFEMAGVK